MTAPMVSKAIQAQQTKNHSLFKSLLGNRRINLLHVNRIKKSMQEQYLFSPITVNEKFQVIDGQHRLEAIKSLGLVVYYHVCNGYGLPEVQRLNANSSTWKSDDYMEGYCELGYEDYLTYREFKKRYNFDHNSCLLLLAQNGAGGQSIKDFYEGRFEIKDYGSAVDLADKITILKQFYEGYNRRSFVFAMNTMLKKPQFSFTEFIGKVRQNPTALVDCTNSGAYQSLIEEIYNYRRREKVNLRYGNELPHS